mmetsp:Transcript_12902/g.37042  ORF Transcript_12902/g.37042 Transcript_12902/m.37042 type:complete len:289 (-) Transcript_12902:618-1484(-)
MTSAHTYPGDEDPGFSCSSLSSNGSFSTDALKSIGTNDVLASASVPTPRVLGSGDPSSRGAMPPPGIAPEALMRGAGALGVSSSGRSAARLSTFRRDGVHTAVRSGSLDAGLDAGLVEERRCPCRRGRGTATRHAGVAPAFIVIRHMDKATAVRSRRGSPKGLFFLQFSFPFFAQVPHRAPRFSWIVSWIGVLSEMMMVSDIKQKGTDHETSRWGSTATDVFLILLRQSSFVQSSPLSSLSSSVLVRTLVPSPLPSPALPPPRFFSRRFPPTTTSPPFPARRAPSSSS